MTEHTVASLGDWMQLQSPIAKIESVERVLALANDSQWRSSEKPGRNVKVLDPKLHPPKAGLNTFAGQARLLHDLANIELQALELAVETCALIRSAGAADGTPLERLRYNTYQALIEELQDIAIEEARHLKLCLDRIEQIGFQWGSFPVHTALWDQAPSGDDLLFRILVVHRHMEASGLDAGARILDKLNGAPRCQIRDVVKTIVDDEIGHVSFGSRWFRQIAAESGVDPFLYFKDQMPKILFQVRRTERLSFDLRKLAGFSVRELNYLHSIQKLV